jgi:chemotaxis protein MotB
MTNRTDSTHSTHSTHSTESTDSTQLDKSPRAGERDRGDATREMMSQAGLGKARAVRTGATLIGVLVVAAAVAGAYWWVNGAVERATVAETSNAAHQETIRQLQTERDELRGKVERLERENAELIALKARLTSEMAAKDEELAKLTAARKELEEKMKAEISAGDIALSDDGGRLRVDLVDKVLFDSGDATISKRGQEVLTRVAAVLAGMQGKLVQVSGHTDDAPPTAKIKDTFPTNWELSTARATNVVRFLQESGGLSGKRLVASGYGQFKPVTTNVNHAGRARNRRIEILLVPEIEAVRASTAKAR